LWRRVVFSTLSRSRKRILASLCQRPREARMPSNPSKQSKRNPFLCVQIQNERIEKWVSYPQPAGSIRNEREKLDPCQIPPPHPALFLFLAIYIHFIQPFKMHVVVGMDRGGMRNGGGMECRCMNEWLGTTRNGGVPKQCGMISFYFIFWFKKN